MGREKGEGRTKEKEMEMEEIEMEMEMEMEKKKGKEKGEGKGSETEQGRESGMKKAAPKGLALLILYLITTVLWEDRANGTTP